MIQVFCIAFLALIVIFTLSFYWKSRDIFDAFHDGLFLAGAVVCGIGFFVILIAGAAGAIS